MPDRLFAPASAFSAPPPQVPGVTVEECTDMSLAAVMLARGADEAFVAKARAGLGFAPPGGPSRVEKGGINLIGTGPGVWLAVAEGHPPGVFAARLADIFAGAASVSDQSSGYAVLRLTGPRARAVLQAALPVDLDPSVFPLAASASTLLGHIGVILWQTGPDVWNLACFRSMADSLAHWLARA